MRILVLAGTAEARALVSALAAEDMPVVASLAGATRAPRPLPAETWTGGFGGAQAMAERLRAAGIGAVIDATHPFAARISARTVETCAALGLPRLALIRPSWPEPAPGAWRRHATLADAVAALPRGASVFAATGRQSLGAFAARADLRVVARVAEPSAPGDAVPPPNVKLLPAAPGDGPAAEAALLRGLEVERLLARNAGGPASAKLEAARALGLTIHMIDRPPPPPGPRAGTVAEALAWARRLSADRPEPGGT